MSPRAAAPAGSRPAAAPSAAPARPSGEQRQRILDLALELMAANGVAGTSMRQLAAACGLNVATLYHYFPSKNDLLRAVIAHRNYHDLLRTVTLPVDPAAPPRRRLAAMVRYIWAETLAERTVWRLLVGESLRGDTSAREVVGELADAVEDAVDRWLGESFPELPYDHGDVTTVLTGQLFGFFLEDLAIAGEPSRLARRADALAGLVFPA